MNAEHLTLPGASYTRVGSGGRGTAVIVGASLSDAEALAEAVSHGLRGPAAARALHAYEKACLGCVRRLVRTGQEFSRSFVGSAA